MCPKSETNLVLHPFVVKQKLPLILCFPSSQGNKVSWGSGALAKTTQFYCYISTCFSIPDEIGWSAGTQTNHLGSDEETV